MHLEFLCDGDDCLDFRFDDCCRKQTSQEQSPLNEPEVQDVIPDDCYLNAYDEERGQHVCELVIIPLVLAVVSSKLMKSHSKRENLQDSCTLLVITSSS